MSVMQTMQLMMAIKSALAGITNVGSKATYAMLQPTTAGVYVAVFNLPTGSAVGDTATITAEAAGYGGFTWGALAGATVALSNVLIGYQLTVQIYKLTQADVAAGTLSVPYTITSSGSWSVAMTGVVDVDRGVGSMDVVGTYTSGSASGFTNCTLPGVTTALDGAVVRYAFFTDSTSVAATITQPVGFISGDPPFSVYSGSSYTGYTKQSVAGASGSVAVGYLSQFTNFKWGGVLVALKPYVPAVFALTGTFPDATVGVPWTGVLTWTGDYTGPVVMDVAAGTKPAWIGTPAVDEGAKTATYSGTPDAATSISFTPRATPAVGTPATAPQTFAVAAASSGAASVVDHAFVTGAGYAAASYTFSDVKAGDTLIVVGTTSATSLTDIALTATGGLTYTMLPFLTNGGRSERAGYINVVADSGTVTVTAKQNNNASDVTSIYVIQVRTALNCNASNIISGFTNSFSRTPISIGPYTLPVGSIGVLVGAWSGQGFSGNSIGFDDSSYVVDAASTAKYGGSIAAYVAPTSGATKTLKLTNACLSNNTKWSVVFYPFTP